MNTKQLFSTLIGTLLAAIFMFSTLAYAQAPQDGQEPQYQHDDADGEYRGKHKGKHHKDKHRKRMAKLMMKRIDTNNDGKIDFNEFITHSEQRFQTMDINSDGYVTPEEARAGHKLMREKMKQAFKERRQTERDSQEADS